LDQGQFSEALKELDSGITVLLKSSDPYQQYGSHIQYISQYYKAVHLLQLVQKFKDQKMYKQAAWILTQIYELDLAFEHRLTILRSAIITNFQIGNFSTAARFIQIIITTGIPDITIYQTALEKCKEENFKECYSPYTDGVKPMCYKTGRLINDNSYVICPFCNAFYHQFADVSKCKFCRSNVITKSYDKKMFE